MGKEHPLLAQCLGRSQYKTGVGAGPGVSREPPGNGLGKHFWEKSWQDGAFEAFARTFRSLTENPGLGCSKIAQSLGVPGMNTSGLRFHSHHLQGSRKQLTQRFSQGATVPKSWFFCTGSESVDLEEEGGGFCF